MKNYLMFILINSLIVLPTFAAAPTSPPPQVTAAPYSSTQETLKNITPENELKRLMEGNARFVNNKPIQRNLLQQAKLTSLKGQFPAAVILSCMDSRGSAEIILDQGLGDVLSARSAGNVVDTDQVGGMEFATKIVGSKLILVMGHTQCGAVGGACANVQLGVLTELLNKIQPAVSKVKEAANGNIDCADYKTVDAIAKQNVLDMMQQIKAKSSIIRDQLSNKQILLVGAMHDLRSGKVTFFDDTGSEIKSTK